jgi:monovalent cation/hydrogen antiporter
VALFEIVIALLFVGALLSATARRLNVPYPALLALAGAGLALFPAAPGVVLDPELALALFVAPVLLDAAFDSSPRDLKQNWRMVTGLALAAVALTVAAVALVARWLVPELPWPAAIALGAIVAPPDAAAATAVLKQMRPPHRLLVILEGESLFNDASALLTYPLALGAAAASGSFSAWRALPELALVAVGSVVLALALSRVSLRLFVRIQDVATTVIVQFLSAFLVWILAEALHLSGIITVVVFAILVARTAPASTPARLRIPSYAVWEVAVFVLNVLAFILVGLQLKPIVQQLDRPRLESFALTAAVVCATVIVVRLLWVAGWAAAGRLGDRRGQLSWRASVLIGWCGMRGIVTLAAALALPHGFSHRDLVLFIAFAVVLGTLVVQGLTLGPLMRLLGLRDDGGVEREVQVARAETARAALAATAASDLPDMVLLLRKKYEARLRASQTAAPPSTDAPIGTEPAAETAGYLAALREAQAAERRALVDLRARGVIGDDAFHKVEEELDWAELNADALARST